MTRRIVSRIEDEIGCSPITERYRFDSLKYLYYDPEMEYDAFADAVARVNTDTAHGMVVWSCGCTSTHHFVVAVQVFDAFVERAAERRHAGGLSFDRDGTSQRPATKRARRQMITARPDEEDETVL